MMQARNGTACLPVGLPPTYVALTFHHRLAILVRQPCPHFQALPIAEVIQEVLSGQPEIPVDPDTGEPAMDETAIQELYVDSWGFNVRLCVHT
jgi:hypothetical protein